MSNDLEEVEKYLTDLGKKYRQEAYQNLMTWAILRSFIAAVFAGILLIASIGDPTSWHNWLILPGAVIVFLLAFWYLRPRKPVV